MYDVLMENRAALVAAVVVSMLASSCKSNRGDSQSPGTESTGKAPVNTPSSAPAKPTSEPCATDMERQPSSARFDCAKDNDCTNNCRFGAINRAWSAVLGPGCKDGCAGKTLGSPRCVERRCVAFLRVGKRDESCTDLPAPTKSVCVPSQH